MSNKRQVKFSILISLLKRKRPVGMIGLVFIPLSILIAVLFILPFSLAFKGENDDYDVASIKRYGVEKEAKITYIKTLNNISINGEHPIIISYEYDNNGNKVTDKLETLDLEKATGYDIGTRIKVLAYKDKAIIKGMEPFIFPIRYFYIIPVIFFITGVILLTIGLIPALQIYNLYKNGVIKDAYIVSVQSGRGSLPTKSLRDSLWVNYYFLDDLNNKIFGESSTNDLMMLTSKKAGDTVKIFVSEKDGTRSCLVPTFEAMKYNWNI